MMQFQIAWCMISKIKINHKSELQKGLIDLGLQRDSITGFSPLINAKILRTPISKSICDRLFLKIYLVLLFWFLEEISEVAFCWHSTKSTHPEVSFQQNCWSLAWNFIKDYITDFFSMNLCFKSTFFRENLRGTVSDI